MNLRRGQRPHMQPVDVHQRPYRLPGIALCSPAAAVREQVPDQDEPAGDGVQADGFVEGGRGAGRRRSRRRSAGRSTPGCCRRDIVRLVLAQRGDDLGGGASDKGAVDGTGVEIQGEGRRASVGVSPLFTVQSRNGWPPPPARDSAKEARAWASPRFLPPSTVPARRYDRS
jgi:hypothetical protein